MEMSMIKRKRKKPEPELDDGAQQNVCECCFLIFYDEKKRNHCEFCELNLDILSKNPIARIDRTIEMMPHSFVATFPLAIRIMWRELKPLLEAHRDRS